MEDTIAKDGAQFGNALSFLANSPTLSATPFLGDGLSLRALIELIQATRTSDASHWQVMERTLGEALDIQDGLPLSSSLYRGMPGIGWAIQLCPPLVEKPTSIQLLAELDEVLLEGMADTRNPNLDLINGMAGIMVYAMRRDKSCEASGGLWNAIESICVRSVRAWLDLSPSRLETRGTDFQRNLGIAHGIPGLLTMMITAFRRGLFSPQSAELALDGFEQLWNHSVRGVSGWALFPGNVGSTQVTRLAWCYGALGLADAYNNASFLDVTNISRYSALVEGSLHQLKAGKHGIMDASLCHGWAGAHYYFDLFAQCAFLGEHIQVECKSASLAAGKAIDGLNVGKDQAPSYPRNYRGRNYKSDTLLAGTSGVLIAQDAVVRSTGLQVWAELLGSFEGADGKSRFAGGLMKEAEERKTSEVME